MKRKDKKKNRCQHPKELIKDWDCGCAFGCDHCAYSRKCSLCGKILRGTIEST